MGNLKKEIEQEINVDELRRDEALDAVGLKETVTKKSTKVSEEQKSKKDSKSGEVKKKPKKELTGDKKVEKVKKTKQEKENKDGEVENVSGILREPTEVEFKENMERVNDVVTTVHGKQLSEDGETKKKPATKKDKVLVELEGLEDDSIDLLFFDPFNRLGDKEVTFKTPEERDKYIKRVQGWLLEARKKLRNKGGGMVIGVDSFTLTSFGDAIFPTEEVKRMLSWYSEQGHGGKQLPTDRGYVNTSIPFLWNVKSKPWTFNKPEDVAFFDGEFKADGGKGLDALDMAQQVVRIFSNEGDTVLELFGKGTVIEQAVVNEGRTYVKGCVV